MVLYSPYLLLPLPSDQVGYTVASQLQPSPLAILRRQDPAHFSTVIHPDHFSRCSSSPHTTCWCSCLAITTAIPTTPWRLAARLT